MTGIRVRRRVRVAGRVQGVWFRESCRDRALTAGVTGWIRNLDDGSVEGVLEGPPSAVDEMVARVDGIDVVDEEPIGEPSFRVR